MNTTDTDIKLPMTELQVMADMELEEKQKLDDPGHTVETINNAILDGEVGVVKEWLSCFEQGDPPPRVCQIDEKDAKQHTFLANAIHNNQSEIALLLICAGADFKTLQDWGTLDQAPIHQAAKKGYKELLWKMIELSPDCVQLNDNRKNPPLHWACSEGHTEIASTLIREHGAKLNVANRKGLTPLLMACKEGRSETVKSLIVNHGAKIDAKDKNGGTPLHWTAFKNASGEVVCLLLDQGAKINALDKLGYTPLHRACRWGRVAVAKALLDHGARVDQENSDGLTPLEVAIHEGSLDCAMAVVESDQWLTAMRRYNSKTDSTPFRELISRMPEVAEKVLDRCCNVDAFNSRMHSSFWVDFNFEFIEDLQDLSQTGGAPGSGNFSTKWGPKTKFSKSNHPLNIMTEKKESWRILAHPLVCCLLHYKWLKFGQLGYFINLFSYCLFLIFLTAFTLVVPNPLSGICNTEANTAAANATASSNETSREENSNTCEGLTESTRVGLYFTAAVILICAVCRLGLEIIQVMRVKMSYFIRLVNWLEITLYVFSFIFVWVFHDECLCPYRWQWQLGIVAVFFAWINLMIFFSKFPLTGVYVLMFTKICRTFLKILVLSLLLVIAFALTFFLIFHEPSVMPSPFSSAAFSILKLSSMVAGDFSFNTILGFESDGTVSFPAISYIMWILFLILMPILFSNLLIALASGDTQAIQEKASLNQLVLLVEQVLAVEELIPSKYRWKWRIGFKRVFPNKIDDSEPVFSKYIDSKLPPKLLSKLRDWVKTVNHAMWGGKDYDTLDSLTRVLNPEEFFTEQKPFESVKQKIIDVNERVVGKTQEQRKKEVSEVQETLCHLQGALEEVKQQTMSKDEMKEMLHQHQEAMISEMRALLERKT